MTRLVSFLSLFTSVGTLLCCALPALLVVLGFGATFAGLIGTFPQLIVLSENKILLFWVGGGLLALAGFFQWQARYQSCPIDSQEACNTTKDWSIKIYFLSLGLYLIGAFFAFAAPLVF